MSQFSIKILFFTVSIIGILCISFLSYKLIPDNTYPSLQISYTWPNASQYAIESKVTAKFEGAFSALKKVKNIYSKSYADYGEIFLEYDKSVDIEKERFMVSTYIRQLYPNLPEGVGYPKILYQRPDNNDVRLMSYSILSNNHEEITTFIDKILTPKITKNENIHAVKFEGIPSQYYEIKYKVQLLHSLGITKAEVITAIENIITTEDLGVIEDDNTMGQEFRVLYHNTHNESSLYTLPIKKVGSKVIRLTDIASLTKKNSADISLFRINGMQTVSFSVIADKSANQITLANSIKKSIHELEAKYTDYHFMLTHDATSHLKEELQSIFLRTLLSFFFLFVFTLLIYRNWHYVLNLFTSLLVTLLLAVIFFRIFGIAIHIYSLMALAISIGFVIDNSIITIDHYLRNKNKKIILPIFAATITTIAPLLLVTFLDDAIKLNLIDFSWTLIIVLASSLIVSFFLIPAIIKPTKHPIKKWRIKKVKKIIFFNTWYLKTIFFLRRFRVLLSMILLFLFGVPLFLLPETIEGDSTWVHYYNASIGNEYYTTEIRPTTDKYLGGVVKLFAENATDGDFLQNPKRLSVSVRIKTPFGSTISYLNEICNKFEESLQINKSLGIDFFQTQIYNERAAQIEVYFEPDTKPNLPYRLKGFLEKESLTMSGVDFTVFGVGKPFGTSSGEFYDSSLILTGYDYQKLNTYATLVTHKLKKNNRIQEVLVQSERSWFVNNNKEYTIKNNEHGITKILTDFNDNYASKEMGSYTLDNRKFALVLTSDIKNDNSSYGILNQQFYLNDSVRYKPRYNLEFDLVKVPDNVVKKNQEYQLVLQYKFNGTYKHGELVREEIINESRKLLVSGFNIADGNSRSFGSADHNLYLPLLICVFIIFSICTILLESFRKSLLIVCTVPITFIGVFISLYRLEIGFNHGVYSALVLLVGLLVNSSIFVINEYTNYNKKLNSKKSYVKAFNIKIVPILITIISTIVGLVPFLISDATNNFWYPFAITICIGLVFSILTIIFIVPIYLISHKSL